jgi:hypothetical protein
MTQQHREGLPIATAYLMNVRRDVTKNANVACSVGCRTCQLRTAIDRPSLMQAESFIHRWMQRKRVRRGVD